VGGAWVAAMVAEGSPRVAYVTANDPRVRAEDSDRPLLLDALADEGLRGEAVAWDADVDWTAFDLIVVRSPWDYPERVAELRAWLAAMAGVPALHNPAAAIEWNLDKRYLRDLADAGVPIVPTAFATSVEEAADAICSVRLDDDEAGAEVGGDVVVKPTVSAGSRDTGRFDRADPEALALAQRIVAGGRVAMVQPAVPSVADRGELAFVLIDGEVSHAYRKGPLLARGGGLLSGDEYREERQRESPPSGWADLARQVHDVVAAQLAADGASAGGPLLYARIDLVELPSGAPALLEAELFEPFLSLDLDPLAAQRFAGACARRIAP
jgi:hypothetical protein